MHTPPDVPGLFLSILTVATLAKEAVVQQHLEDHVFSGFVGDETASPSHQGHWMDPRLRRTVIDPPIPAIAVDVGASLLSKREVHGCSSATQLDPLWLLLFVDLLLSFPDCVTVFLGSVQLADTFATDGWCV